MTTPESISAARSRITPPADTPAEFLAHIRAGRAADTGLDLGRAQTVLFDACLPAIPYAAASAYLGREKVKADPQRFRPAAGRARRRRAGDDARGHPHNSADP